MSAAAFFFAGEGYGIFSRVERPVLGCVRKAHQQRKYYDACHNECPHGLTPSLGFADLIFLRAVTRF
jgi:hypothetical protein